MTRNMASNVIQARRTSTTAPTEAWTNVDHDWEDVGFARSPYVKVLGVPMTDYQWSCRLDEARGEG